MGQRLGFSFNPIPFKGGPDGAMAVAQGEVMVMPVAAPLLLQVRERVRALGWMVEKRNPIASDVPTLREAGIDSPVLSYWGGLAAPTGTPREVADVLTKHVGMALENPVVRQRYMGMGLVPHFQPGPELGRMIEHELKWQADAIRAGNITFN
jgi:tripartite-type tricarboxylate transporter receptor subunit TctC